MKDKRKNIKMSSELHDKIISEAKSNKWSIKVTVEKIINKYFT